MRRLSPLWLLGVVGAVGAAEAPAGFRDVAQPFIEQSCLNCHGEKKAKAGFRIDKLGSDFSAPKVAEQWKEVIDRINAGEMPPEGKARPDEQQSAAFVGWVNGQLHEVELAAKKAGGRILMRRLNRDEYANTVSDLLHIDEKTMGSIAEELPGDGKAEGFDRLGVALFFDQSQVRQSMVAAEQISRLAIVTEPPKVNHFITRFEIQKAKPPPEMVPAYEFSKHLIPTGARDHLVKPDGIEHIQCYPMYRKEWDGWGVVDHPIVSSVVKRDGYYRVRIKAKVDNRDRTIPNKFRLIYAMNSPIQTMLDVLIDPSGMTETLVFLHGPDESGEVKGLQEIKLLWNHTEKAVIQEPNFAKAAGTKQKFAVELERAVTRRAPETELDELRKKRDEAVKVLDAWTGPMHIFNPEYDVEKLPRLFIESIEVEGPVEKEWPPASHKLLFFAGDERQDLGYAREIFARFLPRAYRRPVTTDEIETIVSVVDHALNVSKVSFAEAMRQGLQCLLTSPGFIFLQEPASQAQPRKLNDYELASRLSYFLWSTMPDDALFALAASGKLHEPAVLSAEIRRMLADPKADHLVHNFAGQWLSVRDFASVQPAAEYQNYDRFLEAAAREEPYAFFTEVLAHDLPITNLLDSDFLVINDRLARHYGIGGVDGPEFRRVAIRPEDHRGGVLGMAGLMTFLADGTRTLPMRRGSWVLRELFNDPPNDPPPNAGEIQPNTAGKSLTVRQRMELHRRDEVCASCHQKLDPYGLALENYDAIGQWREQFNGEGFRGNNGPKLEVGGVFPDGRKFSTLEEYKAGLLAQKDRFARAFSTKLLTYALGRPVGYTDRETLDGLVGALKKNDYKIQSLIGAIVASEPFETK
jgi:hypothetical protein